MSIKETKDGTILSVYVKPNSTKFAIALDGEEIIVHATEEPEKGRVNKEIIKELTKVFGSKVEIISGSTSRQKIFLLRDTSKATVEAALSGKF